MIVLQRRSCAPLHLGDESATQEETLVTCQLSRPIQLLHGLSKHAATEESHAKSQVARHLGPGRQDYIGPTSAQNPAHTVTLHTFASLLAS